MTDREYNIKIVEEDGMLWGEVTELPGTFASGETVDELMEAMVEAINMVDPVPVPKERFHRPSPPMPTPVGHVRAARLQLA